MNDITFYDLFAGIGGFRLGLERLGAKCVGSCEIDSYARETYRKNFGELPPQTDIRTVNPSELPDFKILCAGFPCQSFSTAGKRLGFQESRGTLFFEIARIAREKRPGIIFLENVTGLLSNDNGWTFFNILNILQELGYDPEWQVINSKHFVPQNRKRIYIIGHLRGASRGKIFPLGEISKISSREKESTSVRTLMGGGNSGGLHSQMTLIVNDKGKLRETPLCSNLHPNYYRGMDNHGQRTMIMLGHTKANIKKRVQKRSDTWTLEANSNHIGIIYDVKSESQAYRVYNKDGLSPAPRAGHAMNSPNITTGSRIRRLTPLECERLQGFPDNWTKGVSDSQRYKQIGNAVTVPVIEYIGKEILKVI